MHWFRSNTFGTWCAVLALAVQLAVSFGHVHRGGKPWSFGVAPLATTEPSMVLGSPAKPDSNPVGAGFDYCGICTIINLAGSVLPPATPALPLPSVVSAARLRTDIDFSAAPRRHFIFEARAPPRA